MTRPYSLAFKQEMVQRLIGKNALTVDSAFHDTDGQSGFSFAETDWPQGWRGIDSPHGAVFAR